MTAIYYTVKTPEMLHGQTRNGLRYGPACVNALLLPRAMRVEWPYTLLTACTTESHVARMPAEDHMVQRHLAISNHNAPCPTILDSQIQGVALTARNTTGPPAIIGLEAA